MSQKITIPRIYHTIWVGDLEPPMDWIRSWADKNPEWEHRLWDNDAVFGREWRNQKHLEWFKEHKIWAGVADIVRYEILFENGGFAAGADSICLEPIDELFADPAFDAYTCYENEALLGDLCSPLLGCTKENPLAEVLIRMLGAKEVVGIPWKTTGNLFMMHALKALEYPRIKIFPSYTLLPEHHSGAKYEGTGKVYARHMWGNGKNAYQHLKKSTS